MATFHTFQVTVACSNSDPEEVRALVQELLEADPSERIRNIEVTTKE